MCVHSCTYNYNIKLDSGKLFSVEQLTERSPSFSIGRIHRPNWRRLRGARNSEPSTQLFPKRRPKKRVHGGKSLSSVWQSFFTRVIAKRRLSRYSLLSVDPSILLTTAKTSPSGISYTLWIRKKKILARNRQGDSLSLPNLLAKLRKTCSNPRAKSVPRYSSV